MRRFKTKADMINGKYLKKIIMSIGCLFLLTGCGLWLHAMQPDSYVTFYGGAGRVGGSSAIVCNGATKIMVDCGSFYGEEAGEGTGGKDEEFKFNASEVGDLLITHAHADHAGNVMNLIRAGFNGKIRMTEPTKKILEVTWASQCVYEKNVSRHWRWSVRRKTRGIKTHWHPECEYNQKILKKNLKEFVGTYDALCEYVSGISNSAPKYVTGCDVCCQLEIAGVMKRVETVEFDRSIEIKPFTIVFRPVKHLPGAAAIYFDDGVKSFVFSGDLGTYRSRMVANIEPAKKVDAVFVESTYGDGSYGDKAAVDSEYARFADTVVDAVKKRNLIWIPAFAIDRTQRVLIEVSKALEKAGIQDCPVYVLSPSGNAVTDLYCNNCGWFDNFKETEYLRAIQKRVSRRFDPSKENARWGVLVTTSGMMDAGFSKGLIPDLVPDDRVTICLVGYQSPQSPGGRLLKGGKTLTINGRKIKIAAKIEKFSCFSGHGDAREIDEWLSNKRDSAIYLIHGDKDALKARKEGLAARYASKVEIVKPLHEYSIGR
jgi:metallo-beta-lactamase family protein